MEYQFVGTYIPSKIVQMSLSKPVAENPRKSSLQFQRNGIIFGK
jgi:hypothetical protein